MSWLADLLGKEIRTLIDGVESILPMRKTLRIVGSSAIEAKDNPTDGTTDLFIGPSGDLSDVLSNDNDAGGNEIKNLGAPTAPTSALRGQDETHHIFVSSTGTALVSLALLEGRNPASTHVHVSFSGGGAKTLMISSTLTDASVNGMLVTVTANSSSTYLIRVDVQGGTFNGQSGPVLVSQSSSGASGFTIGKFGSGSFSNWSFVEVPLVAPVPLVGSSALLPPAVLQNTAIGYSEELGTRRRTGTTGVGMSVFHRVSRSTFTTASQTLISGGIEGTEVPENCTIVAEADVIAVGSSVYAARIFGTFRVSSGAIEKIYDAVIGPVLPLELSDLQFNVTANAIGVQLVQPSSGPSWTLTTRTRFTVVEDPS